MAHRFDRMVGDFGMPIAIAMDVDDLAGAAVTAFHFRKPSGAEGTWTTGNSVELAVSEAWHVAAADELDVDGDWELVAEVTKLDSSAKIFSEPVILRVGAL